MAVTIEFVADVSAVKEAIDRLVADARSTKIPIGGSFAAGIAAGGGFSSAPTVANTFGANPAASGFAPLANGGFFSAGPGGLGAGVGGSPQAANIFGFPGSPSTALGAGPTVANSPQGATIIAPPASGGLQGGFPPSASIMDSGFSAPAGGGFPSNSQSGRFFGLSTSGLARYVGAGFLAREALRVGQLAQDYSSQTILAGNDQRAQYRAEGTFQHGIESIPVVGQAAGLFSSVIADAGGFGRTGSEATLRSADATDAQSSGIARVFSFTTRQRGEVSLSEGTSAAEHERRTAKEAFEERKREIQELGRLKSAEDEKVIEAERTKRAATRHETDVKRGLLYGPYAFLFDRDAAEAEDNKSLSDLAHQQATQRQAKIDELNTGAETIYNNRLKELDRNEQFRVAGVVRNAGYDVAEDLNVIAGDRRGARDTRTAAKAANALADARQRRAGAGEFFSIFGAIAADTITTTIEDFKEDFIANDQTRRRTRVIEDLSERNPRRAAIDKIEADFQRKLANATPAQAKALRDERIAEEGYTNQRFDDRNELNLLSSRGRGRVLDAALGAGDYAGVSARITDIKERAIFHDLELQKEGIENRPLRRSELSNAQKALQLESRDFLMNFKPEETGNIANLSSGNFASGRGGDNDILNVLKEIADSNRDIAMKLDDVGRAQ